MTIQEYLKHHKMITDGAFGTYYSNKYSTQEIPETANITHPDRVLDIHRSYINAGARLIRTNTFAANTLLLQTDLQKVKENIRAAVKIANDAIQESEHTVYIAGDIGPIPNYQYAQEQYLEIAKTFLEEGVDILSFETFADMEQILPVIQKIKHKDLFIMVQFSVNQFGYSNSGLSARRLIQGASCVDEIDAVGLNCGVGPGHMAQILDKINLDHGKFAIALPNAGYPKLIRNHMQFTDNQHYFVLKVQEMAEKGMDIVGGCCGTNPDYIQKLSAILDIAQNPKKTSTAQNKSPEKQMIKHGFFCNPDGSLKKKKLIAVELAPPANVDDEKIMDAAHILKKSGVDVVTFPDSPSGRTRIDSVLMAEKVKRETNLNVMPHICCRDKNAIAIRSLLMGAQINDIDNMLVITGDPIPVVIRQTVKGVFNFDAVGLMNIIKDMNEEIFTNHSIVYGGAINQGRPNLEVEIKRVRRKIDAGAEFFFTQPVFSKAEADRIRTIKKETGARILCGIMPLISRRNALFMKNEIAGIAVTDEIVNRYPENGTREEGESVGISIAKEVISYTEDFVDGYYFSFPFNKVYLLDKIL